MKAVVMDLLRQYLRVEVQFQHGKNSAIRYKILISEDHFLGDHLVAV